MAGSVYIETSIPSAYVDERDHPISRFQQFETRRWWDEQRERYELFTSDAVIIELEKQAFPGQPQALGLVDDLPILEVTQETLRIADAYMDHFIMPREDMGDGVHLALASMNGLDFLLTWNCRHLANPRKTPHILEINRRLGLKTPIILTPQMFFEET